MAIDAPKIHGNATGLPPNTPDESRSRGFAFSVSSCSDGGAERRGFNFRVALGDHSNQMREVRRDSKTRRDTAG